MYINIVNLKSLNEVRDFIRDVCKKNTKKKILEELLDEIIVEVYKFGWHNGKEKMFKKSARHKEPKHYFYKMGDLPKNYD